MYVSTRGGIPVTLSIGKGDKVFTYYEDLNGDYEDLEVETIDEALEDIVSNIENYYRELSSKRYPSDNIENKIHYIGVFAEHFNIDFNEAIENYYDLKIIPTTIDTTKLEIEVES